MFSVQGSRSALIKIIRDILKNDLSVLKDANGDPTTIPSVIKYRTSGNTPDYPYVTVNYENVITPQDVLVNQSYNETEDRIEYTQFLLVNVAIRCYGDESLDILNKLKRMFYIERYRNRISSESGLSLQNTQNVVETPNLHSTEWVEGATFRLSFYATDTYFDENNTDEFFDKLNANGDIDENSIQVEIV